MTWSPNINISKNNAWPVAFSFNHKQNYDLEKFGGNGGCWIAKLATSSRNYDFRQFYFDYSVFIYQKGHIQLHIHINGNN